MGVGITINENTRQVVLLDNFTKEASKGTDTLYVYVDSLPIYLSTSIAFSIFSYKLKNYPRQILWRTKNPEIVEVLESANLDVDHLYTHEAQKEKKKIEDTVSKITAQKNLEPPKEQVMHLEDNLQPTPEPLPHTDSQESKQEESVFDFSSFTNSNVKSVEDGVLPQKVVEEGEAGQKTEFDTWIKKIEATKSALDSLKDDKVKDERIRVAGKPVVQVDTKPVQRPKVFMFMSSLFTAAVALMAALILFPSSVYTLSVSPPIMEDQISLSIPVSAFSKQSVTINEESTKPTSGTENQETTRARGRISLLNEGSDPVVLAGSDYYFDYNSARYVMLSNQTLPESIVIPPQNTEPIVVDIQAANAGVEYNIGQGERMEIYNLLGQQFCNACYAIAETSIEAVESDQTKTVSLADQDVLRNTVDSLVAQKRVETYIDLASQTAISDPAWYKNVDSTFVFNHGVGELASELTLQVDVNTNLFYLSKNELYSVLEQENESAAEIVDVELLETSGDFGGDGDIDITLIYRYKLKTDLDKDKITKTLKQQEINEAREIIQTEFPSVKRIAQEETGVSIPGVRPRVNVNIVETK